MLVSELTDGKGNTRVAVRIEGDARLVNGADSVYALALEAIRARESLRTVLDKRGLGDKVDLDAAYAEGRLNSPISHPDPAHLHLTGTGLTHLGSAATRDSMHKKLTADGEENLTDSMKMFRMGLDGGKPARGEVGVQPEWFYKGNGAFAVAPGKPLMSPDFARDAGEEPEIAGIYVIGDDGAPFRLGFALSNEFSDHVTERVNYLYLAHSKLRNAVVRPGDPGRRPARRYQGHVAHPSRRQGAVGKAVPVGRGEHVAHHRQSRAPPLQIRAVPPAGRCARPHVRHGDLVLRRRHPHRARRHLRDRGAGLRTAAAQSA